METERGHVVAFVVRYDAFIDGRWRNIAIFDTHGDFAHWHRCDPLTGKGEKHQIPLDHKAALTYAFDVIRAQWEEWRREYERGLRGYEQQTLF